jgi:hypothetical protein
MYLRAKKGFNRRSSPSAGDEEAFQMWPKHAFGRPTRLADGLELESAPIRLNLRPRKFAVFGLSAANWQASVGSPAAAFFHTALGCIWLYYTSTFQAACPQTRVGLSQLIDAIAIAQNEIDVTPIDGSR